MTILNQMKDIIARYAEKHGYPVPQFLLTREEFLNTIKPEDRAKWEEYLDKGFHSPGFYEKGKVYFFVEGCENFRADVAETMAHEYAHADNAEFPENVNALTYAVEDTHEVSEDELIEILNRLSQSYKYENDAAIMEERGKNPHTMLADEVIAHAVARMTVEGEGALESITLQPHKAQRCSRMDGQASEGYGHRLEAHRQASVCL